MHVNTLIGLSMCAQALGVAGRVALEALKTHKEAIISTIAAQVVVTALVMSLEKGKAFALGDPTRSRAFKVDDYAKCPADKGLIAPETIHSEVSQLIRIMNNPQPLIEMNKHSEGKITIDRGMLLSGTTGSGKTEHAFKFAKEIGARVLYANAAALVDAAQGSGAKAIQGFFERAAHRSLLFSIKSRFLSLMSGVHLIRPYYEKPTVVILENIQAIARPREGDISGTNAVQKLEREKTFEQLLYEIDHLQGNNVLPRIFVIGISNFSPRILDTALSQRPQRARLVELPCTLTAERRKQILQYHRSRFAGCHFDVAFDNGAGFDVFAARADTNNASILRQTVETAVTRSASDGQPVTFARMEDAYQSLRGYMR